MSHTAINPDARILELSEILAGEVRIALDAFEELETVALEIGAHAEGRRAEAIMERTSDLVAEMLELKPSTLLGFFASDMARKWSLGQWPGMPEIDA